MATHSSILAWEILCTEKSGGLQSMGVARQTRFSKLNHHIHYENNGIKPVMFCEYIWAIQKTISINDNRTAIMHKGINIHIYIFFSQ